MSDTVARRAREYTDHIGRGRRGQARYEGSRTWCAEHASPRYVCQWEHDTDAVELAARLEEAR